MNPYAEFLNKGECLLLLVDLQKSMLDLCVEAERVRKNAAALIEIARILDFPVIFSEHYAEKLGGFLPELVKKVGNPVVRNKVEFSCFENQGLKRAIGETGRQTLILAGIETHVCIFQTAAHGLRRGYRVHVAADAVSSRGRLNHDIGLRRMEQAGAVMSSTEMVVFELLNRAGTPDFRKALPLIKAL